MWIGKQLCVLSMKLFTGQRGVGFKNVLIFDHMEFANKAISFSSYSDKSYSTEKIARLLPSELSRRAVCPFFIPM